mmetsp:Transcript_125712/g.246369  ORF Transcript_125712/g.246369 Transcript_125712/m.246369 type:complete len:201 (+) Transcript_125712:36-638(+)
MQQADAPTLDRAVSSAKQCVHCRWPAWYWMLTVWHGVRRAAVERLLTAVIAQWNGQQYASSSCWSQYHCWTILKSMASRVREGVGVQDSVRANAGDGPEAGKPAEDSEAVGRWLGGVLVPSGGSAASFASCGASATRVASSGGVATAWEARPPATRCAATRAETRARSAGPRSGSMPRTARIASCQGLNSCRVAKSSKSS